MRRIALFVMLLSFSVPAPAQTPQIPPDFPKKEFFGDMFALLYFCNLHDITDRYEMFVARLSATLAIHTDSLPIYCRRVAVVGRHPAALVAANACRCEATKSCTVIGRLPVSLAMNLSSPENRPF